MYQSSILWDQNVFRWDIFRWTSTRVLGGTNGVALKLKLLRYAAYDDRDGFLLDDWRRFRVITAWGNIWSDADAGKDVSYEQRSEIRWFLNIHMDRFSAFLLCIWGGTSWKSTSVLLNTSLILCEHLLSKMCILGNSPWYFNSMKVCCHASVMILDWWFLIGTAWIELVSKWYNMKM